MLRLIKRYESRKLYDTEESRYISLDEIAAWVRSGQEVRVIDNATSDDVTAQTLTQVILEEGRNGRSRIPSEVMHDLLRFGERALSNGVAQVQQSMDRVVQASFDRLAPVRQAREEMKRLRARLEQLEESLVDLEAGGARGRGRTVPTPRRRPAARKTGRRTGLPVKKTVKKTVEKKS